MVFQCWFNKEPFCESFDALGGEAHERLETEK